MSTQQIGPGHHVRVNREDSWYHGERGVVIGQGRSWGWLLVEFVKDGKTYRSEIRRGHLVQILDPVRIVQEGETPT